MSTTSYDYDENNWLLTEITVAGNTTTTTRYFYDPNGNQIYKGTETVRPKVAGDEEIVTVSLVGESAENADSTIQGQGDRYLVPI